MKRKSLLSLLIAMMIFMLLSFGCSNVNDTKSDDIKTESDSKKDKKDENKDSEEAIDIDASVDDGTEGDSEEEGYYQFAIFGNDGCTGCEEDGITSDTIMIVSVDKKSREIRVCSIHPYTYLEITDDVYLTCDLAYAHQGPEGAVEMLNTNFDLDIQGYVMMDFKSLVDIIDGLGGVSVELYTYDIDYLNEHQTALAFDLDMKDQYVEVEDIGLQHLNGLQACAYSEIARAPVTNTPFLRMPKQLELLKLLFEQAKEYDSDYLEGICNNAYPFIISSYDLSIMTEYINQIGDYTISDTSRYPFGKYEEVDIDYYDRTAVFTLDHQADVIMLHEFLFPEEDYKPSGNVKRISDNIANELGGDEEEAAVIEPGTFAPMQSPVPLAKYPESFREVYVRINGAELEAYTDDRYYIFFAQLPSGTKAWCVYDSYEKLFVKYDENFMNASGDASYIRPDDLDDRVADGSFIPMDSLGEPEVLPRDFREVYVRIDGTELKAWMNDEYYIFYAESPLGFQDWYIYDAEEKLFIRYEPSFMAGGY